MAGRSLADHGERGWQVRDVGCAYGIAVHGRGIEGRLRKQCCERGSQRAPVRRLDGDGLGRRRGDGVEYAGEGVLDGEGRGHGYGLPSSAAR